MKNRDGDELLALEEIIRTHILQIDDKSAIITRLEKEVNEISRDYAEAVVGAELEMDFIKDIIPLINENRVTNNSIINRLNEFFEDKQK